MGEKSMHRGTGSYHGRRSGGNFENLVTSRHDMLRRFQRLFAYRLEGRYVSMNELIGLRMVNMVAVLFLVLEYGGSTKDTDDNEFNIGFLSYI